MARNNGAPIPTWQNVGSKSDGAANALLTNSIRGIGDATDGLAGNIDDYRNDRQETETQDFIATLNAANTPQERDELMLAAKSSFVNMQQANAANISAERLGFDRQDQQIQNDAAAYTNQINKFNLDDKIRTEGYRVDRNNILSGELSNDDFNQSVLEYKQSGGPIDPSLKSEAQRRFREDAAIKVIPELDFVDKYNIDPTDNGTYNQEKYNQIVSDQSDRIRAAHTGLSEEEILKSAKETVGKTKHGRAFKAQKWFEDQNRTEQQATLELDRKDLNKKEFRVQRAAVNAEYKKNGYSERYQQLVADLDTFTNAEDLGEARVKQVQDLTARAVTDYLGDNFNVEESFASMSAGVRAQQGGGEDVVGPDGKGGLSIQPGPRGLELSDFAPTHVRDWLDAETKALKEKFPRADRATLQSSLLQKLGDSAVGPRIIAAAIPAQVQAAANKFEGTNATNALASRNRILQGFHDSSATSFDRSEKFAEIAKSTGTSLTGAEKTKLSAQMALARSQWMGYFPGVPAGKQRDTIKVAIHRIMMETFIDTDKWDPNDVAHGTINPSGDITNDSSAVKNRVLTALLGQISPNAYPRASNLVKSRLEEAVKKLESKVAKKPKPKSPSTGDTALDTAAQYIVP